ncbi:M16 family metallopeptidase [Aurantiacibacter rhizosphaerae]|uniref:Insulinase family protein n=1 Tax=Aurantiacibacter rhizosphaerae TaxID=2691582 RepID=A0A844XCW0_9SPHN|nr:M16 family metallopeptidase [Aurantiacibacter rhizosphaerae]MWV27670.1 insulinase family protein [Aurantiacibacter rhizosphaerae]
MTIRRAFNTGISCAALAITLALSAPAAAQQEWGTQATDVVQDPAVTYGVLENGMRYAIRQNDTPDGAASFRMHFDFGSLGEADDERGLAHFIEHMAFNGSTNVPEGEMIPLLERLGLAFGPDTNAYTSFDETVYMLDVPNANEEGLDTALFLMRETASELTFDPEAVDREREILVSERRLRDTAPLRNFRDLFDFRIPGTRYTTRFPIGLDSVLREAPAERLKALYNRFYRPENATFVAVGDFDVAEMEAAIRERFADWQGVGEPGAIPAAGTVDFNREIAFDTFVDPTISESVAIYQHRPYTDPVDTVEERTRSQLRGLAEAMFDRRITRIANREDSPILGGGFGVSDDEDVADYSVVSISTRDGAWDEGLRIAEQELRRALEYGFTQAELDYALTNTESGLRRSAAQAGARTNSQLASALVNAAAENDFVTDPQWRYDLFNQMRPQLTLEAVNELFRDLWSEGEPLVRVAAKEMTGGEETVAAIYNESAQVAVAEPEDVVATDFAYADWGEPGTVISDSMIDDLGIRTVTFANNVRLNIKQTDFEPGRVRFNVNMDGGNFALDGMNSTSAGIYLQIASQVGGLGKHSFDEITEILAGQQVSAGIGADTDVFNSGGVTTPEDLAMQMKVSAAYLTDLGLRPEADARFAAVIDAIWGQLQSQPSQVFNLRTGEQIADSPYTAFPTREELGSVDREALRDAVLSAAANGAIEIAIVGDIDPAAAIDAVANSFGALPERNAEFADYADKRQLDFLDLSGDEITDYTHTGQADQALVGSIWRTRDDTDFQEDMGLALLSGLMNLKALETLREELAATYSPSVSNSTSEDFTDYGTFSVAAVVDPAQADEVRDIIVRLASELRDEAVTDDFLLRARQPILERIRQARENNGFWISIASDAQSEAKRLDRVRQQAEVIESFTPAQLQELARKYITPDRRADTRILVAPEAADSK